MSLKSCGAGGRTRTDMSVTSPDFESGAYTNFATPAWVSHDRGRPRLSQTRVVQGKRHDLGLDDYPSRYLRGRCPAAWPKATDDNTNTAKVAVNDKKSDFL